MKKRVKLSEDELLSLYQKGMSLKAIGLKCGVTKERIRQILETTGKYKNRCKIHINKIEVLFNQGLLRREIAKKIGISPCTVSKWIAKKGLLRKVPIKNVQDSIVYVPYNRKILFEAIVCRIKNRVPAVTIANEFKLSLRSLNCFITKYKLSPRDGYTKYKQILPELEKLLKEGKYYTDIATILGIKDYTVGILKRKFFSNIKSIRCYPRTRKPNRIDLIPHYETIAKKYACGSKLEILAKEYSCGLGTIARILDKSGVPRSHKPASLNL